MKEIVRDSEIERDLIILAFAVPVLLVRFLFDFYRTYTRAETLFSSRRTTIRTHGDRTP